MHANSIRRPSRAGTTGRAGAATAQARHQGRRPGRRTRRTAIAAVSDRGRHRGGLRDGALWRGRGGAPHVLAGVRRLARLRAAGVQRDRPRGADPGRGARVDDRRLGVRARCGPLGGDRVDLRRRHRLGGVDARVVGRGRGHGRGHPHRRRRRGRRPGRCGRRGRRRCLDPLRRRLGARHPPAMGGDHEQWAFDVASGSGGLLVAGGENVWGEIRPRLWFSADGAEWTSVDGGPGGPFDGTGEESVRAIAAFGEGFVAIGDRTVDNEQDGLVWYSPDGETWEEVDAPNLRGPGRQQVLSLAAHDGGLVAGGSSDLTGDGQGDPVVWRSADGRTWDPVSGELPMTLGRSGVQRPRGPLRDVQPHGGPDRRRGERVAASHAGSRPTAACTGPSCPTPCTATCSRTACPSAPRRRSTASPWRSRPSPPCCASTAPDGRTPPATPSPRPRHSRSPPRSPPSPMGRRSPPGACSPQPRARPVSGSSDSSGTARATGGRASTAPPSPPGTSSTSRRSPAGTSPWGSRTSGSPRAARTSATATPTGSSGCRRTAPTGRASGCRTPERTRRSSSSSTTRRSPAWRRRSPSSRPRRRPCRPTPRAARAPGRSPASCPSRTGSSPSGRTTTTTTATRSSSSRPTARASPPSPPRTPAPARRSTPTCASTPTGCRSPSGSPGPHGRTTPSPPCASRDRGGSPVRAAASPATASRRPTRVPPVTRASSWSAPTTAPGTATPGCGSRKTARTGPTSSRASSAAPATSGRRPWLPTPTAVG